MISRPRTAMGFYELQDIRIRVWDARDRDESGVPIFTALEMTQVLDEVERLRHMVIDIRDLVKDATPDHTTTPKESEVKE